MTAERVNGPHAGDYKDQPWNVRPGGLTSQGINIQHKQIHWQKVMQKKWHSLKYILDVSVLVYVMHQFTLKVPCATLKPASLYLNESIHVTYILCCVIYREMFSGIEMFMSWLTYLAWNVRLGFHFSGIVIMYWHFVHLCNSAEVLGFERERGQYDF